MMNKNLFKNPLVTIGIHVSFFILMYFIMSFFGFIKGFPTDQSLMQWDAYWYKSIVDNGYSFIAGQQSNVAFFPFFPVLWKLTSLSPLWISFVNLIFMLSGMLILQRTFNLNRKDFLLVLSIPSLFFCYIPYSEAIFFFAGSLIIYGLKKENWVAIVGIFIACLTRSSTLMFIPIILFSKLYNYQANKNNKKRIVETLLLTLTAIFSTLFALYVQYLESGVFFTIFQTQESWNRVMGMPVLYFTTWDEARLIWLDGLAFFIGVISFILCVVLVFKKYLNRQKTISSHFLFSLSYLALVAIVALLYSGQDALGGSTLYSLNRFIFATPFFSVFLIMLLKRNRLNNKAILFFVIISIITWSLFNMHGYLHNLEKFALPILKTKVYFGILFLYSLLYLIITNRSYKNQLWSGLYVFNILLQIYLFSAFLNGTWIG